MTEPPASRHLRLVTDAPGRAAAPDLEAFTMWGWEQRTWAESTRADYAANVARTHRWLLAHRGTGIVEAEPEDLAAWMSDQPPTVRTRNTYRCAVVAYYDHLLAIGERADNPARALPVLRPPKGLPEALTLAQARAVLATCEQVDVEVGATVTLMLYAPLRNTEARTLTWAAIDGDWLRFTAKGGKDRVLPLHPLAAGVLERWQRSCPSLTWVLPSRRDPGRHISFSGLAYRVAKIGRLAGVPGLHPHQLRHTAATRLVEEGVDIRYVQELLGHEWLSTTQIYTMVRPVRLRDAIAKLAY